MGVARWKIDLSNIQLFGLDLRIARDSIGAPTNLQFVIDVFSDTTRKKSTPNIDLTINSALIRRSSVRYDVLSEPHKPQGTFDVHHMAVTDLLATMSLKALTSDTVNLYVKRLSCKEQSGLMLDRLAFRVEGNRQRVVASQFSVQTSNSQLQTDTAAITLPVTLSGEAFADSAHMIVTMRDVVVVPSDLHLCCPLCDSLICPFH